MMRVIRDIAIGTLLITTAACRDDGDERDSGPGEAGSPDLVGSVCEVPADCYPELDHEDLHGDVLCMERVRGGYCSHECVSDDDCCAVEGECLTDLPQVCSPFESLGIRMCFLSCERSDWEGAGYSDEQSFCQHEASPYFICRSSGGGGLNRKICVPADCGVGADCTGDEHCDGDLECVDHFDGGYCSQRDCASDAECPGASVCIEVDDRSYCARPCDDDVDCGLCRHPDVAGVCTTDVVYVGDSTVPVCAP